VVTTITIRQDSAASLFVSVTSHCDILPFVIRRACRSASREDGLTSDATTSATEVGVNIDLGRTTDVPGLIEFLELETRLVWHQMTGVDAFVEVIQ
jgi:hypothetical protein